METFCWIQDNWLANQINVYLGWYGTPTGTSMTFLTPDGEKTVEMTNGLIPNDLKASFVLPRLYAEEMLRAITKSMNDRGIKVPLQASIDGELKATKIHLEDMRKLVFDAG